MLKILTINILIITSISSYASAQQNNNISLLVKKYTTKKCFNIVKNIENKFIPKNLKIKTITNIDKINKSFSSITIVDYNGDDSHININAFPTSNNKCNVSYNETFSFQGPCIIAREQIFKRWKFIGKMINSLVFVYKKDNKLFGFLTQQGNNRTCLIQKQKTFNY